VDGVPVIERPRHAPEVRVEPCDVSARYWIDLRIPERVRLSGLGDDERLILEVDRDERDPKRSARDERPIAPVRTGDGPIVGPGHVVLVLPDLRIEHRRKHRGRRRLGRCRPEQRDQADEAGPDDREHSQRPVHARIIR
jgi:hypothetical protein